MDPDDLLESALLPVLRALKEHLSDLVLIGGWVPQLHRRFGGNPGWSSDPVATVELDILLPDESPEAKSGSLAETLLAAGFRPVGESQPSAVWERDGTRGERIEFFLDHRGPETQRGVVKTGPSQARVAGMSLEGLAFLRENSVELRVPPPPGAGKAEALMVRVPTLPAFLAHKGAVFFRRWERHRKAKDLLYIVEIMAQGPAVVEPTERELARLCRASKPVSSVVRIARNNVAVLLSQPDAGLLALVAEALQVRYGWSQSLATARTRGFLSDFVEAIPEDCGG